MSHNSFLHYVLTDLLYGSKLVLISLILFQIMIVDYKLTYPSGTATAYLINGFHTPEGAKLAKYVHTVLLLATLTL
jgi:uncharacterized oligopeptide transporter (OPT) family protein